MKRMKKFFALVLSAAMLLSLCVTAAMAFTPDNGSITVENPTATATYNAYKLFDLTYSATDSSKVSYTLNATENAALYAAITAEDSPFKAKASSTENVYDISSTATASEIAGWLKDKTDVMGRVYTPVTGKTEGSIVFEYLPYGYYYVTSTLGTVATITSTKPDVTVVDKNQEPSWDNNPNPPADDPFKPGPGKVIVNEDGSKVTENSASIGDKMNFSIAVNATSYVGDELVTYYYITDTLDDGFGAASDIKVSVAGAELASTAYSVRTSTDGQSFQITIPFGEKYGANAKIEVTYSAVLQDDAVIGGDGNVNTANFTYATLLIDPDNPVVPGDPDDPTKPDKPFDPKNPDDPNYPDDPYDPGENPDDPTVPVPYDPTDSDDPSNPPYDPDNKKETTTYTYAIGVYKIDGNTGTALKGAGFSLATTTVTHSSGGSGWLDDPDVFDEGVGETVIYTTVNVYAVQDKNKDGTAIPGVYTVCASDAAGAVTTFMVDDNGKLTIKGLAEGKYTLTETVRPEGYNAIEPKEIIITSDNAGATSLNNSVTAETVTYGVEVLPLEVKNFSGTELPTTGGIGTTLFYAAGAILAIGAGVLMITKKRMA